MRYPEFLKEKDTIGLVAPSFGACGSPYGLRYDKAVELYKELGYSIQSVDHINTIVKGQSASPQKRAEGFMQMYENSEINFVWSVCGGEKELQVLPYIDFEKIKNVPPKYFMGYSDNTTLSFTLTTLCDVASIYGDHIIDFGVNTWEGCLENAYQLIQGKKLKHTAFPLIQLNDLKHEQPYYGYNLEFPNEWKNINVEKVDVRGRIIGGCLDVLVGMCGTRFDKVEEFADKYKEDGIIWYLEACDLTSFGAMRALWQLKEANWFKHVKAFLIGRPNNPDTIMEYSHEMAVREILEDFNVPIITEFDTGHVAPTIPIINGSIAHVISTNEEHSIEFILE